MEKFFKSVMLFAMTLSLSMGFTACNDDDDNDDPFTEQEEQLTAVNKQFVTNTAIATYKGLADACEELQEKLENMSTQADLQEVCNLWKSSRQYWEWSEAFLFGAASGYGIDPHIDTWPFDVTAFNNFMSKFSPAENEDDAANIDEIVATGQNLTGFHALEYVIFREGQPRQITDITADEIYFANSVAADLYLSACRLEAAWAGLDNVKKSRQTLLEEAELEPADDFGTELSNAGKAGSRWKTATLGAIQIIDGCQDIIGEVADSKIAAAYSGDDPTYIESPHAYNSIQDFYDNIMSCKHALYGGLTVNGKTPASGSLMAYCQKEFSTEASAAMTALENALDKINSMERPFVKNYTDASAGVAIEALHELDEALDALKDKLNG
ncbi:MAG: peptidase M75 [Prevotella sp.]|nr:peptidase M75 [Prevotella sp.]